MFDDEEVVLAESELHKYIKSNYDYEGNDFRDISELVNSDTIYHNPNKFDGFTGDSRESDIPFSTTEKFDFPENYSSIVHAILKTGLLYPDHINELEGHLHLNSVHERNYFKISTAIYGACIVASSPLVLLNNFKFLQCVGFAAVTFCSYKLSTLVKIHFETSKINKFATAIENFFSINKQVLSFILESEFLLRSKVIKDQQVYLPSNGWIHLNSTDGLKNSGLLVPELRKMLMSTYIEVISMFNNFLKYMNKNLFIIPSVIDSLELPEEFYTFQQQTDFTPSSEDLKKLSTVYLLLQSECLKSIILSFVKDVKTNTTLRNTTNTEITLLLNGFVSHTKILKFLYIKCMNEIKHRNLSIRGNALQAGNTSSKLYIFIKSFLTKADAHVLSLFLDLKMINDWVNEFEENNKDNNSDVNKKLVIMLYDRLHQLKSNLECFTTLYNDNCNLLRSMADKNSQEPCHNDFDLKEKFNETVTITGIKVGKSDFECSGEDEVLISLSNCDDDNKCTNKSRLVDYEEEVIKKCLPKSVLNELKCALKNKKEEWIEREKKATSNQNVSIDSLDFDNLLTSTTVFKPSRTDNENSPIGEHNETKQFQGIVDSSCLIHEKFDNGIDSASETNNYRNDELNASINGDSLYYSFDTNFSNVSASTSVSSDDTLISNSAFSIRTGSFVDQIKLAQRSFNLNTSEEEVLGDSSEDEET